MLGRRVCGCNRGLPGRGRLSTGLNVDHAALHRTVHVLTSSKLLRIEHKLNAFITRPLGRCTRKDVSFRRFSGLGVALESLCRAHVVFRPRTTTLTNHETARSRVGRVLHLNSVYRRRLLHSPRNGQEVSSRTTFRNTVLGTSRGSFLDQFVPVLARAVRRAFTLGFGLSVVTRRTCGSRVLVVSFLRGHSTITLGDTIAVRLRRTLLARRVSLRRGRGGC